MKRTSSTLLSAAAIVAATVSFWSTTIYAGPIFVPETARISFQARFTDNSGDPLPDGLVELTFNLYHPINGLVEGPIVLANVPISSGIVDVYIPFANSSFNGEARELGVSINGGMELAPRIPMAASAHAYRVDRVENDELTNDVELGDSAGKGTLSLFGPAGTLTGYFDGGSGFGSELYLRDGTGSPKASIEGMTGTYKSESAYQILDFEGGGLLGSFYTPATGGSQIEMFDGANRAAWAGTSASGGGFFNAYQVGGGLTLALDGADGALGGAAITARNANVFTTVDIDADDGGDTGSRISMFDGISETVRIDARTGGGGSAPSEGSTFTMWNGSGTATVLLDANDGNSARLTLGNNSSVATIVADGNGLAGGGTFGVFNSSGTQTVRVFGDNSGSGYLSLSNAAADATVIATADDGDSGRITISDRTQATVVIDGSGNNGGGSGRFFNSNGVLTTSIEPDTGNHGNIHLFNGAATETIELDSNDGSGSRVTLSDNSGVETVIVDGSGIDGGGNVTLYNSNGDLRVRIDGDNADAGLISLTNAAGTNTITLASDFNGNGRIFTQELQITGGSDLSEQFTINAKPSAIEPGMVVCIDPNEPGALVISTKAYDRTVAGIVSGAGGVRPGMLMGQKGTIADGAYPVALSGRVYCKVDESGGEIQLGDLLTTSNKSGCCMKVTDHANAQGAIIGKAMSKPVDGMVLVLVSLQ